MSFSPDGRYVWAKDTQADEAMPHSIFLLDAQTGDKIQHIEIEAGETGKSTTQRVSWEPGGSVLFDVWNDGEMAVVRCATSAEGDCDLATDPAPHDEPMAPNLLYTLAERH